MFKQEFKRLIGIGAYVSEKLALAILFVKDKDEFEEHRAYVTFGFSFDGDMGVPKEKKLRAVPCKGGKLYDILPELIEDYLKTEGRNLTCRVLDYTKSRLALGYFTVYNQDGQEGIETIIKGIIQKARDTETSVKDAIGAEGIHAISGKSAFRLYDRAHNQKEKTSIIESVKKEVIKDQVFGPGNIESDKQEKGYNETPTENVKGPSRLGKIMQYVAQHIPYIRKKPKK